jgi:hypothetical protein
MALALFCAGRVVNQASIDRARPKRETPTGQRPHDGPCGNNQVPEHYTKNSLAPLLTYLQLLSWISPVSV